MIDVNISKLIIHKLGNIFIPFSKSIRKHFL